MTDTLTKKQRSKLMSKVRSGDTKPEWVLRCGLHRLGFRYRLNNSHLPGKPDLVLPKFQAVVFVNGCFWHRHPGCKEASTPKSNVDFWEKKFAGTVARDRRIAGELQNLGWRTLVVWECELLNNAVETIRGVADWLTRGKVSYDDGLKEQELLRVAENKIRYRISSYDDGVELHDSE